MIDFAWAPWVLQLVAFLAASSWADLINGLFESAGGFFITLSIVKLHREKLVRGVSWIHAAFFSTWGYWNLYFYPHLDQWMSFTGGAFLVAANTFWLLQMWYYLQREKIVCASQISPYLAKCKRLRLDGPTPCLCCDGECRG